MFVNVCLPVIHFGRNTAIDENLNESDEELLKPLTLTSTTIKAGQLCKPLLSQFCSHYAKDSNTQVTLGCVTTATLLTLSIMRKGGGVKQLIVI